MDQSESINDLEAHLDRLYELAKDASKELRHAAAVELLNPYLRHRPDHAWACYLLGRSLLRIGLYHEAERALLRADEFADNQPSPQIQLGSLYRDLGHYDQAEKCFAKAVEHPKAADWGWVWIQRGGNLARMNQLEAAESCHRRALTLSNTDHDEAWLNIGLVLRGKGQYQEATEAFRKALEITPDYEEALKALSSLRDIDSAVALARRTPEPAGG